MDSFSSVPPHIQPPTAQVPRAIREALRVVPLMLMYSSMLSVSPCLFGILGFLEIHALLQPVNSSALAAWSSGPRTWRIIFRVSRLIVRSAVTIGSPRLVFLFLPDHRLVFALRTQASHDRHTLVIKEKNCACLWPVHSLDHILNCDKGRGAGRARNTENLILWFPRRCARAVCRD